VQNLPQQVEDFWKGMGKMPNFYQDAMSSRFPIKKFFRKDMNK
jgi:hypothetical protein